MGPRDRQRALGALALLLMLLLAAVTASASAQAATLSGTVTGQDGGETPAALAGATVAAADAVSGTPVATTTSDPLGDYLLTLPDGDYDVTVSAAGREPLTRRGLAVGGAARLDATLVPTGYGRVFGTVADADGDPLPDVAIGFLFRAGETTGAADGSFSLAVPQGGSPWLQLAGGPAATSWTAVVDGAAAPGEQRELTIRVPPMTTLTARVLGTADVPLEGIETVLPSLQLDAPAGSGFTATFRNDLRSGVTDANGEFSGQVLDHGTALFADRIEVYPADGSFYFPLREATPPVDGPTVATLRLVEYGSLLLHLRDADGEPVSASTTTYRVTRITGSDLDIRWPEGLETVTVAPRVLGGPPPWRFVSEPYLFEGANEETLRLPALAPTTIRVVDENGDPIEGAGVVNPQFDVAAGPSTFPGTLTIPVQLAGSYVTDADGEVTIDTYAGMVADPATPGLVTPPSGRGYEPEVRYTVTSVGGTTTVVVPQLRPAPAIAFAPTPEPAGGSGDWWSVNSVAVAVTADDPDGVASLACTVDGVARRFAQTTTPTTRSGTVNVSGEGRHLLACDAADTVGDLSAGERRVWIDRHKPGKPSIATDRPADSANGWWRDAVTATVTDSGDPLLADGSAGSGVDPASVPAPVVHDSSGRFVVSATVSDRAGNVSAVRRATVKVDADGPTSTLTCPASPVRAGTVARASWLDGDGQSGLAGASRGRLPLDTATPGSHTAEHVATDRVGHQTTSSCTYDVV